MKIRESHIFITGALSLSCLFLGLLAIIAGIFYYYETSDIIILLFGCLIFIYGLVELIIELLNYIWVDGNGITLYHLNKKEKSLDLLDIQSILICQVMFHGIRNQYIVLDDGTFSNKKISERKVLSKKTRKLESWIAIEYSAKRLAILKSMLPNRPIEILPPNTY